jgi:hypothetical protein
MVSGPLFVPQRVNPQTAPLQCVPADDNDGLYEAGEAIYIMHERTTLSGGSEFSHRYMLGLEKKTFFLCLTLCRGHHVTRRGNLHIPMLHHIALASEWPLTRKKLESAMHLNNICNNLQFLSNL